MSQLRLRLNRVKSVLVTCFDGGGLQSEMLK